MIQMSDLIIDKNIKPTKKELKSVKRWAKKEIKEWEKFIKLIEEMLND